MLEKWFTETRARSVSSGRPFITLTYAQSLDGSITHRRGEPGLAISGPETKALTHWLRTQHDGLLIGIGTLISDDPKLTVTHAEGTPPRPVILDSHLRTQPSARVFKHPRPPLIACLEGEAESAQANTLRAAGAEILSLTPAPLLISGLVPARVEGEEGRERIDLCALIEALPRHGIHALMVEGGATVITAFLQQQLADVAVITLAPFFVGGVNVSTEALPSLPRLKDVSSARYGDDTVIWGAFA